MLAGAWFRFKPNTAQGVWGISDCSIVLLTVSRVPPNCEFYVDDFDLGLGRRNVDFIHARGLFGSIRDLKQFLGNVIYE